MKLQIIISALTFFIFIGFLQSAAKEWTTLPTEQKISELTADDQNRLVKQRKVIEAYIANESSRQKYKSAAGKLGLLRFLLENKVFNASQTYELQCMGIVLGDALAQELGLRWVIVEDEYGRDPAINLDGTTIFLYPLTMISKRIERGEEVDIFELFNGVAEIYDEYKLDRHKYTQPIN